MFKAFFYKEFIKTRWFFVCSALVLWVLTAYVVVNISNLFALKGTRVMWLATNTNDYIYMYIVQYAPLIIGVLAGVVQFVPELLQRRIKLTLHLPCSYLRSIGTMLFFGELMLYVIFSIAIFIIVGVYIKFYPCEISFSAAYVMVVWSLAGMQAYMLTAWICLEPSFARRIVYVIVSASMLRVFFLSDEPGAYSHFLIPMLIVLLLSSSLPFIAVRRLKEGKESVI